MKLKNQNRRRDEKVNSNMKIGDEQSDMMTRYIDYIRKFPLLSHGEEKEIGKMLYDLRSRIDVERKGSDPEFRKRKTIEELDRKMMTVRQLLINSNLRLVVSIAKKYRARRFPMMDLISEGNLGLIEAVDRCDFSKENRFSTYATFWIRHYIRNAIANNSSWLCGMPQYMYNKIYQLEDARSRLQIEKGRMPTDSELSRELNISLNQVESIRKNSFFLSPPAEGLEGQDILDMIEDPGSRDSYSFMEMKETHKELMNVIDSFPDRISEIVKLRFGLCGDEEATLSEIGESVGLSAERVRQLLNLAMNEIRNYEPLMELIS